MVSLAAEWGELPHAPRVKQLRVATPKGGRTREVPPSNEAIAALKARRHLKGEYAFCETDGRRLTHSRVKSVVPSTCKKAGLAKRLTTHDLRHTFGVTPGHEGRRAEGGAGAPRSREHRRWRRATPTSRRR